MTYSYYYLVASLPMFEFGMKMPFSYDVFLKKCEEELSSRDMGIVKERRSSPLLKEWRDFDTTLKNEITKFRAGKKGKDPLQYIKERELQDPFIARFAHWVTTLDSPIEAELAIDRFRWVKIEELERGHYFDVEFLVAYALKLKILERWQNIRSSSGMEVLEELVGHTLVCP